MEATVEKLLKVEGCVVNMIRSIDGGFLVILDSEQNVIVHDLSKGGEFSIPTYYSPVTAVGINPNSKVIIVVYADSMIKEYDLFTKQYTNFCKSFLYRNSTKALNHCSAIRNVSFDNENGSLILLHDDSSIIVLDKEGKANSTEPQQQNKIKRRESFHEDKSREEDDNIAGKFNFVQRSHQILYFSHVKDKSVISVEVDPVQLHDRLPPAFREKKYGGV